MTCLTCNIIELIIGFAQNISVSESENATLCITFSSEFSTNFSISIGPLLQHNLTLPGIGKSYFIISFLSLSNNEDTSVYNGTTLYFPP